MSKDIQIKFLEKSLTFMHQLRTAYDSKANFLLSVSGILFILSISQYEVIYFKVLSIFSLLAIIFCLLSINPPFRQTSSEANKSLFCWWGMRGKKYKDYIKEVKENIKTEEDLVREYSKETYLIYHESIRHKNIYLKLANTSLLAGFIVVFIYLIF